MSWQTELRDVAPSDGREAFAAGHCIGLETSVIGNTLVASGAPLMSGRASGWSAKPDLSVAMAHRNSVPLRPAQRAATIGLFINAVVEFTIVAFVLLCVVKAFNASSKNQLAALPA